MHRATPYPQMKPAAAVITPKKRKAEEQWAPRLEAAAPVAAAVAAAAAPASRPQAQLRPAGYRPPQIYAGAAATSSRPFLPAPRPPPPQLLQPRLQPPAPQRKMVTIPRAPLAAAPAASRQTDGQAKAAIPAHRPVAPIQPPVPQQQPARQPETRAHRAGHAASKSTGPIGNEKKALPFELSQKHVAKAKPAEPAKPAKIGKRAVLDLTEHAEDSAEEESASQVERNRPPQTLTEWLESSPHPSPEPPAPSPQAEPIRTFGHPDVLSVVVILGDERDKLEAELQARTGTADRADEDDEADSSVPALSLFPWGKLRRHLRKTHGGIEEAADDATPSPSPSPAECANDADSEMHAEDSGEDNPARSSAVTAAASTTHQPVALPANLRALPPRNPSRGMSAFPASSWPPTRARTP